MVGEDRVIMSVQELRRVSVIRQTMEQKRTQVNAGLLLGLTPATSGASSSGWRRRATRGWRIGDGAGLEPADPGAGQGHGAAAVCAAGWGRWPDGGSREAD